MRLQVALTLTALIGCDGILVVHGKVVDSSGLPVSGARVQTYPNDVRSYESDANGCFEVAQMCSPFFGKVPLRVSATGYKDVAGSVNSPGERQVQIVVEPQGSAREGRIENGIAATGCIAASGDDHREILTLARGPCFGDCPSYEVTLFQSGRVRFGKTVDPDLGPPDERMLPAAVDKSRSLTKKLDSLDVTCCDCYDMTDMPSATITYRRPDGMMRKIQHYHGCEKAPDWLYSVENEIDAILETDRWIGRKMDYRPYHPTGPTHQTRAR